MLGTFLRSGSEVFNVGVGFGGFVIVSGWGEVSWVVWVVAGVFMVGVFGVNEALF